MDTITHGIAGALIGKAVFGGDDLVAFRPMTRKRVVTWAATLGAIFPDSDILRDMFSHDPLLIMTWHRSVTHSLLGMPIFALALAALTWGITRALKWETPSFAALTRIYAIGILSHIVLDLATSFGTMIWSPWKWSRPAWDLLFIVDFTLSALLLGPQLLAWVYRKPENLKNRASITWSLAALATVGVTAIAQNVGAPISAATTVSIIAVLSIFFLLPASRGMGLRVRYATWNRVGLAVACGYVGMTFLAHHAALEQVKKFAGVFQLQVESWGALPLPPSLWHWDGLINTPRGVYEVRFALSDVWFGKSTAQGAGGSELAAMEHRYYPDAAPNSYIEAARRLPDVQKVFWFARFPVTRFHKEGTEAVVEISDMRFAQLGKDRGRAFTFAVRMDEAGRVISQGWERE